MKADLAIPFIISNAVAIAVAIVSMIWPTIARVLLAALFVGAAVVNAYTAIADPSLYLTFGELTKSDLYRSIIFGPFASDVLLYILIISSCQLLIGVFTLHKGPLFKMAMLGGIAFLLAIAPLGSGSAFPSSVIMAMACLILLQKRIDVSVYDVFRSGSKQIKHSHFDI